MVPPGPTPRSRTGPGTEPGAGGGTEAGGSCPASGPSGCESPAAEPRARRAQPAPGAARVPLPRGTGVTVTVTVTVTVPPGRRPSAGPPLQPPAESGPKLCGAEQCGEDYLSFRRPGEGSGGRGGGSGAAPRRRSRGGTGRLSPPQGRLRNPGEPSPIPSRPGRGQAGWVCGAPRRPRAFARGAFGAAPRSAPFCPVPSPPPCACRPGDRWEAGGAAELQTLRSGESLISRSPRCRSKPCTSRFPREVHTSTRAAQLVAMSPGTLLIFPQLKKHHQWRSKQFK